jgi:hypothetical protein
MLKLLVVAVVAALAAPAAAGAATIHTPADGLITQQGQPVCFDWAWDFDEYATASIVLTRSSEPTSPLWQYGPTVPASADRQAFSDCSYGVCSPWLDSHATLTFDTTAQATGGGGFATSRSTARTTSAATTRPSRPGS